MALQYSESSRKGRLINQLQMPLNESFANANSLEVIVIRLLHDNFHICSIIDGIILSIRVVNVEFNLEKVFKRF